MTPRLTFWDAIRQASNDFDRYLAETAHGDLCECERCRVNQMDSDLQPPVTYVKPEDRTP